MIVLSNDMLLVIISFLDPLDLISLCFISKRFYNIVISDEFLYLIRRRLSEYTGLITTSYNIRTLMRLCKQPRVKNISTRGSHSLILRNGLVYSMSANTSGQLGLGDTYTRTQPTLIPNLTNIIAISANASYSLVLNNKGQVYSFGNNIYGQLGLGKLHRNFLLIPTMINVPDIVQIATGTRQSLLLSIDGTVYGFGENTYGQLGSKLDNIYYPSLIPDLINIVSVSIYDNHSLALNEFGQVYAFGDNTFGQLNIKFHSTSYPSLIPNIMNIKQIAAGSSYSLLLTKSGQLHIFGDLHIEHKLDNISDIYEDSLISNNQLYILSPTSISIENIDQVSIGNDFTLIQDRKGRVYLDNQILIFE